MPKSVVNQQYQRIYLAMKNAPSKMKLSDFADKSLLIVDDDDPFRNRLRSRNGVQRFFCSSS